MPISKGPQGPLLTTIPDTENLPQPRLSAVGISGLQGGEDVKKETIMGVEFFQTLMGRKYFESDVPRIARALERIAKAMEAGVESLSAEKIGNNVIEAVIQAQRSGFDVREDVDQPGRYLFFYPDGEGSDLSFDSSDEAWRQVIAIMENQDG